MTRSIDDVVHNTVYSDISDHILKRVYVEPLVLHAMVTVMGSVARAAEQALMGDVW